MLDFGVCSWAITYMVQLNPLIEPVPFKNE